MGTALGEEQLAWAKWPQDLAASNMIQRSARPKAIEEFKGAITRAPFFSNEPIREEKVIKGNGSGFLSAILPAGKRAVAISIDSRGATSAGGFILPNDFVDVIVTRRDIDASTRTGTDIYQSVTILSGIRVLAIGQNIQEKNGEKVVVGETATLELDPTQAEQVQMHQRSGTLALTLRSLADANKEDGPAPAARAIRSRWFDSACRRRSPIDDPPFLSPFRPQTGGTIMRPALRNLLLGACALLAAGPAFAAPPPKHFGGVPFESVPVPRIQPTDHDQVMARRVDLSIGKSIVIDLPRDAAEVFVSDPKVANAVVRTARKVFIIGTGQGTTSVFVTDKSGAQIAALDIGVAKELARELSILREVIKKALPKADIKVTSVGDNFVLSGTVDSSLEVQSAIDIANNLVGQTAGIGGVTASVGKVVNALQVRGRDQVMLKVTIAEVQRSVLKQLGINLNGQWNVANSGLSMLTDQPFSVQRQLLSNTELVGRAAGNTATMRALERQGVLRTLAEPTLTAISGESAKFLAGGEVAVPQAETFDIVTRARTVSVSYKPIGVALNFTPVVMNENRISIRLATEVTEIDPENSFLLNTTQVPASGPARLRPRLNCPPAPCWPRPA